MSLLAPKECPECAAPVHTGSSVTSPRRPLCSGCKIQSDRCQAPKGRGKEEPTHLAGALRLFVLPTLPEARRRKPGRAAGIERGVSQRKVECLLYCARVSAMTGRVTPCSKRGSLHLSQGGPPPQANRLMLYRSPRMEQSLIVEDVPGAVRRAVV